MSLMPTITVIGSLNMDLVTYTPRVPIGGETMTASSFTTALGGKGANQAIACAKLSRPNPQSTTRRIEAGTVVVRMIGAVGDDAYGASMKTEMQEHGVDVSGILVQSETKTGVAVILVEENSGENRILLSPGANHTLLPEYFQELLPPLPSLLILQLEIPLLTVLQILETAKRQGVEVLFNPAPAQNIPKEYYPAISHLVVNESEASLLSGCAESTLNTIDGLTSVAQKFQSLGAKTIIITLGGRGVYYLGQDSASGIVPAEKVDVVDTTAAGDTFIGAYALEVVKPDFELESAVRWANRAAAKTVQRRGAQESIPWLDE